MKRKLGIIRMALAILVMAVITAASYNYLSENDSNLTSYQQYAQEKIGKKRAGQVRADSPKLHGIIQRELRTKIGDEGPNYGPNQVYEEYLKAKNRSASKARMAQSELNFIERGPGNVAGRTRGLIVDPEDPNQETFYAGSASGGVWKTTDAGANWAFISGDIPNMGVNTLAMAPSKTDVIYAGTGEHFTNDIDGAGMFKSIDRGESWFQIANPSELTDFKNVSRIVVDPNDENIVVATTRSTVWGSFRASIYKTVDGGQNWTRVRTSTSERFDDLDYDPSNFNTIYAAIRGVGVIKSLDAGDTWSYSNNGLSPSGRVEITVSPVNTNRIWASVEGGVSGTASDLYVSNDAGATWLLVVNENGQNEDFLGGQGWYDNIITAHPFDADIVYVGGVNKWKFTLTGSNAQEVKTISPVQDGTEAFMSFINFGGAFLGGGMDLGEVAEKDLLPIEVRFGEGTQMAHRFTVNGQGPGVPAASYTYRDYVEVPFQVWDTENDVQLMVSFRDQQEDGAWNLIASNTDGDGSSHSREYLFIHNTAYSGTASAEIAVNGGHENGQMYFFWPVLAAGASFDPANLPQSSLDVVFQVTQGLVRETTSVTDAYGQYGGPNSFPQQTRTSGLHPDQHNIVTYDLDEENQTFRILSGNDGGVYRTVASTDPGPHEGDYEYISYGYNTTQFYGADKAPGQNRYIGGMQDNGTWFHPSGTQGAADADAKFAIGGDGFESLWHSSDPNKLIGGSQYNNFARSTNGGQTWTNATAGFNDDGPFVTRLAHHKSMPDRIFTVGASGVWVSPSFGSSWSASTMNQASLWSFSNSADVEVSYANPDVIWAGGALHADGRLFVSTDGGASFNPCENYADFDMGGVSGFGTHPNDDQVAYALFSFAGFPKVIKTTDQGQTWTDISGFDGTGAASTRGFPDVAINCIYVFSNNADKIWVGSEIGIIESLDGGSTWGLLESNMPPVNVYDFKQVDDQLVIATYGRGIWSVTIDGLIAPPALLSGFTSPTGAWNFEAQFYAYFDSAEIYLDGEIHSTTYEITSGTQSIITVAAENEGNKMGKVVSYLGGTAYESDETELFLVNLSEASESYATDFSNAESDFTLNDFSITSTTDLGDVALHSAHPYGMDQDLYTYLKTPIIVNFKNDQLTYEDIALVEPGAAGSAYGDESFNDYVALEATKDGKTWIALGLGYDASANSDWLTAYESGAVNEALYKTHRISLFDYFPNSTKVMLRFKLHTNGTNDGYGWVIDNLSIQDKSNILTAPSRKVNVYPNPIKDLATITFEGAIPREVTVFTISGEKVTQILTNGQSKLEWRPENLTNGIYLLQYLSGEQRVSQKIILE